MKPEAGTVMEEVYRKDPHDAARLWASTGKACPPLTHRLFNLLAAAIGLVLLSPFFAVVALLIKLSDGGPVLYRAQRVGKDGILFRLYKFRTMIPDADRRGAGITHAGDSRITPLGRILRRTKLDELPQLINVVLGDMNLVGPRPEDPRYVALYTDEQRRILTFKPGMTSPASLQFSHEEELLTGNDFLETYTNELLPRKLALEMAYFPGQTITGDVPLILRTCGAIIGIIR